MFFSPSLFIEHGVLTYCTFLGAQNHRLSHTAAYYLHVLHREMEGVEEVKKKKKKEKRRQWESSAWICECVWQRGQPWRRVPAPQHRKWHMTALTFVIPCLPPPLKLSLKQTPRLAKIHTLKDTQSHTHTVYCLDYIIFIPRTWALLVGWHLGLCSTKVTFPWPWVKMPVCSMHLKWRMRRKEKKKRKSQMRKISKSALIRGINSHAQTC